MKPRCLIAAVLAAALLFLVAGWATSAEPPKPAPTFSVVGLAVEDGLLVVHFKATYPPGMSGAWDPEAVKATIARLVTVLDGKWTWQTYTPELRGSGPVPPPPPPPPPPTELWGIVVEESSQRTAGQAAIITSTEIRDLLGKDNFRVVDKDSEVQADMKPYVDRAKTRKLPQLFLVDKMGYVFFEGDLPADKAATAALIRKFKPGGPR